MQSYIGVKLIKASTLMTKVNYCEYRGWTVPEDEDPDELVYLVEYEKDENSKQNHPDHEGYISMSPKDVFEKAYRRTDSLTFGLAIEALKLGKKVARAGWNGNGMFVYMVNGCTLEKQMLRGEASEALKDVLQPEIKICSHIDMKAADGSIVVGWLASQTDMLAEDWVIIE